MMQFLIKQPTAKRKGIYTNVHFGVNHVITKVDGILINTDKANALPVVQANALLQIEPLIYLDLNGNTSWFFNHSCNANTRIKIIAKNAFLVSTRAIQPDEELCFDYSLTSTEFPTTWSVACDCGSWNCRKTISGFNTLSKEIKNAYIKQGIVPNYILGIK